jgi:hypothetical protein
MKQEDTIADATITRKIQEMLTKKTEIATKSEG